MATCSADVAALPKILQYKRAIPDPESKDYLAITEEKGTKENKFNNCSRLLCEVEIMGKTVLIDSDTKKNSLYEQFFNGDREDLSEIRIYAETVTIRNRLHIPQTKLTIYANELRFEDKENETPASVCTTPSKRFLTEKGIGENGDDGEPAGGIILYIKEFSASSDDQKRFFLIGGDGQKAGPGRDGVQGRSYRILQNVWKPPVGNGLIGWEGCDGSKHGVRKGTWPENGRPAKPAGNPGNGGRGGDLIATLPLGRLADLAGGKSGARGLDNDETPETYEGGAAGTPNPAYYGKFTCGRTDPTWSHRQTKGESASVPPLAEQGDPGRFLLIEDENSWFHPFMLHPVLLHARDAYINGNLEYTEEKIKKYMDAYEQRRGFVPESYQRDMDQLLREMKGLLFRIENNLDYFGNPAGWTPMLSFEATIDAYGNEIDSSIRILYLTYWLNKKADKIESKINGYREARKQLRNEIGTFIKNYNEMQQIVPYLRAQGLRIRDSIEVLEKELGVIEDDLKREAEEKYKEVTTVPAWKKHLQIASKICRAIPVYQPVLGTLGSGMDLAADIGSNQSLSLTDTLRYASGFVNFFDKMNSSRIEKDTDKLKLQFNEIDAKNMDIDDAQRYFQDISNTANMVTEKLENFTSDLKQTKVSNGQIRRLFNEMKIAHPKWKRLKQDLHELNIEKEKYAQRLTGAIQTIVKMTNDITSGVLEFDRISRDLGTKLRSIDHAALFHLKEIERRAKERLLYYQYLMVKGYEYRMLKPYSGVVGIDRLFESFKDIAEEGDLTLSREEFLDLREVYEEELRNITRNVLDTLVRDAPSRVILSGFKLDDDELNILNRRKPQKMMINLKNRGGIFSINHENLRIRNIKVTSVKTKFEESGNIFISFVHLGNSKIESKAEIFRFTHQTGRLDTPVSWEAVYNKKTGITNSILNPNAESLLFELLGKYEDKSSIALFSCPSAWADLSMEVEANRHVHLDEIGMEVEYEFSRKPKL